MKVVSLNGDAWSMKLLIKDEKAVRRMHCYNVAGSFCRQSAVARDRYCERNYGSRRAKAG